MVMKDGTVLISGAGIAGEAFAHALLNFDFTPTIVEREREICTASGVIDVWGSGYDAIERMGLLPRVQAASTHVDRLELVDRHGHHAAAIDTKVMREVSHGRYLTIHRNELCAVLRGAIGPRCELMLGDSITHIEENDTGVLVHFEHAPAKLFELVVGADGMHSNVRHLIFPEAPDLPEYQLGYTVAVVEVPRTPADREGVVMVYAEPSRQIARVALDAGTTIALILLAEAHPERVPLTDVAAQKLYLREQLTGMHGDLEPVLDAIDHSSSFYFDRVSQIRMDLWHRGRVALLGDAAYAPSQLTRQAASLALAGAYVLAGELARATAPKNAFASYQAQLEPLVADLQRELEAWIHAIAPKTRLGVAMRDQATKLLQLPVVARHFFGRSMKSTIGLQDYSYSRWPPEREAPHTRSDTQPM
jgi:2-polyprenyl-6-methoxyphenol hydroxylase-like FAD-dependent oxidoreductase